MNSYVCVTLSVISLGGIVGAGIAAGYGFLHMSSLSDQKPRDESSN